MVGIYPMPGKHFWERGAEESADDLNMSAAATTESKEMLRQNGYTPVDEAVPPIGYSVMVVTQHFRCIGFLDRSLNWRYASDHGLLRDVIAWASADHAK